ncbi:MAG: hypothetical protein JW900_01110 [Anaerolineae bacterium]|nr:hypothetical protein [Anaerolineae bacterium]
MYRSLVALASVLVLVASPCNTAQQNELSMDVIVGFDGYCRLGGWCPVYAVLANEGEDVEGELCVQAPGTESPGDVYCTAVQLPAHSRKAYFVYVPVISNRTSRIAIELAAGQQTLAAQQTAIRYLERTDWLYGVISSTPSNLNFLADVAPASGNAVVSHLDVDSLPPDLLGWSGLDVLVLNDVDSSALTGSQRAALEEWISMGGHLIVGGGANGPQTATAVLDLLPVTPGTIETVETLSGLSSLVDAAQHPAPYPVLASSLADGDVLARQDDLILVARRREGAGTVTFTAFDAGLNVFVDWRDNIRLWSTLTATQFPATNHLTVQDSYNAISAMQAIPNLHALSLLHVIGFLIVYIILIGPLNYFVLHKLDRREWAWITIPLLIVAFTALSYLTGFQIRGNSPILHQLAVVYVPQEAPLGRATEMVGIFSPHRARYDIQVPAGGIRRMFSTSFYADSSHQPLHVTEQVDHWTARSVRVDVGDMQYLQRDSYVEVAAIESTLQIATLTSSQLHISGEVTNGSIPLRDAVLLTAQHEQRLGALAPGQSFTVDLPFASYASSFSNLPERILGPGDYWSDQDTYRQYMLLQAFFPYNNPTIMIPGIYLVGWSDEPLSPLGIAGRNSVQKGVTLYIYHLPATYLGTGDQSNVPKELIVPYLEQTTGNTSINDSYLRLSYGGTATFRFSAWPGAATDQGARVTLILDRWTGSSQAPPQVSLWDWEQGTWQAITVGWGDTVIPSAQRFIHPSNILRVQLRAPANEYVELQSIAIRIER